MTDRKCVMCGKRVVPYDPSLYVYHKCVNNADCWFCGWNCMRSYERRNPPKQKRKSRGVYMT